MSFETAPYYCEENVWRLCAEPTIVGRPRAAVVISNVARSVAVNHQRAAPSPGSPVVWDYHVVLAARTDGAWMVWDVDSTLGMPVPLAHYLNESFGLPEGFGEALAPCFRVVEAQQYRDVLATDRRHMLDGDGRYQVAPPPWPPIGTGSNLMRFVDMEDDIAGTVVEADGLAWALDQLEAVRR